MRIDLAVERFGNSLPNFISVNANDFQNSPEQAVFYGLAGNDFFSYSNLAGLNNAQTVPILIGGTGGDSYNFSAFSNILVYIQDSGSSSGDQLNIPGVSFSSDQTFFGEIDGKHLAITTTRNLGLGPIQQTYLLWDWQSTANQIETFSTADGSFTFDQFRSRVRSDNQYQVNISLSDVTDSAELVDSVLAILALQGTLLELFPPTVYWYNRSNGDFVQWSMSEGSYIESTHFPNVTVSNEWQLAGAGSFNFDITNDLIWRNQNTGQNVIWYMGDQGIIQSSHLPTVADQAWKIEATADLNGDLDDDLIWRNYQTGQNAVWFLNSGGQPTIQYLATSVSDLNWHIEAGGDFDGDGNDDLLWRNYASGELRQWSMEGVTLISSSSLGVKVSDLNWQVQGSTNMDYLSAGDEILWRNSVTGESRIWYLENGQYLDSVAFNSQISDPSWQMVG